MSSENHINQPLTIEEPYNNIILPLLDVVISGTYIAPVNAYMRNNTHPGPSIKT